MVALSLNTSNVLPVTFAVTQIKQMVSLATAQRPTMYATRIKLKSIVFILLLHLVLACVHLALSAQETQFFRLLLKIFQLILLEHLHKAQLHMVLWWKFAM